MTTQRERVAEALFNHLLNGNKMPGPYGGYKWPAPEQHLPWWYAAADAAIAAMDVRCGHCGHVGAPGDDHSCPCSYSDAMCLDHPDALRAPTTTDAESGETHE